MQRSEVLQKCSGSDLVGFKQTTFFTYTGRLAGIIWDTKSVVRPLILYHVSCDWFLPVALHSRTVGGPLKKGRGGNILLGRGLGSRTCDTWAKSSFTYQKDHSLEKCDTCDTWMEKLWAWGSNLLPKSCSKGEVTY